MLDARRHLFWDNIKDADSIMFRWEELRCYYERLLNQPEVLAWPTMYDARGSHRPL
eukprot:COSAG05_NODE_18997_length_299_cov_1.040000_1_plen_56_part_00